MNTTDVKTRTYTDIPYLSSTATTASRCTCPCSISSANLTGSLSVTVLAAMSYAVAMATRNWSASGVVMKMGLWDYCISLAGNNSWQCLPVNTDFSIATQAFSILSCMCYTCMGVLYMIYLMFRFLQTSRPLIISMCLTAFSVVTLQIMTMIVYGVKNGEVYTKIGRQLFGEMDNLYLSWSFYFACISTIMATVSGVLLFVEFKNLTYEAIQDST